MYKKFKIKNQETESSSWLFSSHSSGRFIWPQICFRKREKEKRSQYRPPDFVLNNRVNIKKRGCFYRLKFFLFEYTDVIYIFLFFSTFTLNTQPNGNQEVKKNDLKKKKKKEIQEVKKQW